MGSNNISPPPEDFNSISPSADCNIIESLPASKILIDWPSSVVIVNSWAVEPNTFVPSMYKDADDRYKSLNWWVGEPKSYVLSVEGISEPLKVCVPTKVFEPVVA